MYCGDAWAAGLFEGEGSFTTRRKKHRPGYAQMQASLAMRDEATVRRFFATVRVGGLCLCANGMWTWQCYGDSVARVYYVLGPWLSERRKAQYRAVLADRKEYESVRGAALEPMYAARRWRA